MKSRKSKSVRKKAKSRKRSRRTRSSRYRSTSEIGVVSPSQYKRRQILTKKLEELVQTTTGKENEYDNQNIDFHVTSEYQDVFELWENGVPLPRGSPHIKVELHGRSYTAFPDPRDGLIILHPDRKRAPIMSKYSYVHRYSQMSAPTNYEQLKSIPFETLKVLYKQRFINVSYKTHSLSPTFKLDNVIKMDDDREGKFKIMLTPFTQYLSDTRGSFSPVIDGVGNEMSVQNKNGILYLDEKTILDALLVN